MHLITLVLLLIFGWLSSTQAQTTQAWAWLPDSAALSPDKKHIDVSDNGNNGRAQPNPTSLDVGRNRASLVLQNTNQYAVAGANQGFAQVVGPADNSNQRASASSFGDGGGAANAGQSNRGVWRNSQDGNGDRYANLSANGQASLNTEDVQNSQGGQNNFWANNTRNSNQFWGARPTSLNSGDSSGGLLVGNANGQSNTYLYDTQKKGNDWDASIQDPKAAASQGSNFNLITSLFGGGQATKYNCVAQKVGESICYDNYGRQAGRVVATDSGAITVYSKDGIRVADGQCTPSTGDQKNWDCKIFNMVDSSIDSYSETDCMADYGKSSNTKLHISRPLTFNYRSQTNPDGTKVFKWPDCFDISGYVQLEGFSQAQLQDFAQRAAVEWVVNVLPVGRLRCIDPGTCGRDCYYCDLCHQGQNDHKLDMLDNTQSNACNLNSDQRVQLKATVCPPPGNFPWAACTGFTKQLGDEYWQKKGDIDVQMKIYLRPQTVDQIKQQFFQDTSGFTGGITMTSLKAQYAAANAQTLNFQASDADIEKFYIDQKIKAQSGDPNGELVGCLHSLAKFNIGAKNVDTSFLLEAGAAGADPGSFFRNAKCPQWDAMQTQQYNADKSQYQPTNSGGGLGGLFGGGSSSGSSSGFLFG